MAMIGLTGGIGSGKTCAAERFAELGIPVINADAIGHEVIAPGGAAVDAVVEEFGESILTEGIIDREKVAAVVFNDEHKRLRLNAITHPIIERTVAERCAKLIRDGSHDVIIEAALLAENGKTDPWLDKLILVSCPEEIRIDRLVKTRGMDRAEAQRRAAAQTPPESKRAIADWVIDNSDTIEAMHHQVDEVAQEIKDL